jgi:hypothetical protein
MANFALGLFCVTGAPPFRDWHGSSGGINLLIIAQKHSCVDLKVATLTKNSTTPLADKAWENE